MSKIYEALRRAEMDRDKSALLPAPETAPPVPEPHSAVAAIDDLTERPAFVLPDPQHILAEPSRGRLPILLGPGIGPTNGRLAGRPNGGSNGHAKAASNGSAREKDTPKIRSKNIANNIPDVAHVAPEPVTDSRSHRTATSETAEHIAAALPLEDAFVVPFDHTQIGTRLWKPSFNQLPALQERGGSIEQFRSLRSRLHEFRDLNTLKSVLVSSGLPQEGKSFVAANLAISFARHKSSRVLLIDGDMRRPSQHKLLGCDVGPGLTEYLSGKATLVEVAHRGHLEDESAILPHGLASLTFISGGTEGDKAADLSGNRRFDKLIATVSPFFDWIIVDTSPVNLVSDGVNLARACDGVLLITRGGRTKFETAQRALSELKASKILGVVINAVKDAPGGAGYYGYYGYYGGYYGYNNYDPIKEPAKEPTKE